MSTLYKCLRLERTDRGWATLAFNRPDKLNTLSIELRRELDNAVEMLEADDGVHVLILTGTGKAFTAGLDLKDWDSSGDPAAGAYRWDAVASLKKFRGPVIAAINGLTITGGVEIALACDVVIASELASFADTHVRVGLLPGWGGSVRMIERVGLHRAKELALTGRFFSAQEAAKWGFVNHVVAHDELIPRAEAMAAEMLLSPTVNVKAYKALLDAEAVLSMSQALKLERCQSQAINSPVTQAEILARLKRMVESS